MLCTSYVPVDCQHRGLNVCESGFSWHPSNCDANNDEERGNITVFPSYNMDQHLDLNKEALRQIIQKHEATFRHQLQELHRVYRRQRELMDEIRVREIFMQHLQLQTPELNHSLSEAQSEISQTASHSASWIIGNSSDSLSVLATKDVLGPIFVAENFLDATIVGTGPSETKNSYNKVKALSSRSKEHEIRICGPQLPADMYRGSREAIKCEEVKTFKPPKQDSELCPVKMGDLSTSSLKYRNTIFFIDLNEPAQLEPVASSSSSSFEPYECHKEIMPNVPRVAGVAEPNSVAPKHSVGMNSLVGIDLNAMPLSCLSEAVVQENLLNTSEESKLEDPKENLLPSIAKKDHSRMVPLSSKDEMTCDYDDNKTVVLNYSSVHDRSMNNAMCAERNPVLDKKINDKSLKTKAQVDLNTGVILEENFPSLSSTNVGTKSVRETTLEAPVSPENKDFPIRGKYEDILLETTPLLSEIRKREPEVELDRIAAKTLHFISLSKVQDLNFNNCLYWFADIVSSTCNDNDLENEVLKLHNGANDKDQGEIELDRIDDFQVKKLKLSQKNAGNLSHAVRKEKNIGTLFGRSASYCATKDLPLIKSLPITGSMKRNARRKSCAKAKNSKLSHSNINKSVTTILKEPCIVLQDWGKIKKRQGGHRYRASKFLIIS